MGELRCGGWGVRAVGEVGVVLVWVGSCEGRLKTSWGEGVMGVSWGDGRCWGEAGVGSRVVLGKDLGFSGRVYRQGRAWGGELG